MNKTTQFKNQDSILIDTTELCSLLRCGRYTAIKVGDLAKARVTINRRVLWNRSKIENYVNQISE